MKQEIIDRINALRQQMKNAGITATIIPQTDPHQGEYLASHFQVRRFLSGFTGSAGTLVVTPAEALLWADSRYFIQAANQLEGTGIKLMKEGLPATPGIADYLVQNLVSNSKLMPTSSTLYGPTVPHYPMLPRLSMKTNMPDAMPLTKSTIFSATHACRVPMPCLSRLSMR